MGVDARGGQDARCLRLARVLPAQLQRLVHGVRTLADPDRQHRPHPLLPGAVEQLIPVAVIARAVEVCVRVDQICSKTFQKTTQTKRRKLPKPSE